jgi:hypothetical protein
VGFDSSFTEKIMEGASFEIKEAQVMQNSVRDETVNEDGL